MAERVWTDEQQRAINHERGPLRIIAGAGSGKTATMTEHIARLITSGAAEPDQIVALTFTNSAASELTERIQRTLGDSRIEVWSGTYHSFGGQIVSDGATVLDLPAEPLLLSQVESWLIVRGILQDGLEIEQRDLANFGTAINELVAQISRCKDELVSSADLRTYIATIPDEDELHSADMRDLLRVYEAYEHRCQLRGAIDFGDQIQLAVRALDDDPDLLAEYHNRYRFFVVDEYQDTNYAQAELVRKLSAPDFHLRVVGDPHQSIYRFRGAAVDNIVRFEKEIQGVTDVALSTNFRSHQRILDVANRIVESTDLVTTLRAHEDRTGPAPVIANAEQWSEEVQWIAETLQAHRDHDAEQAMAVLVRKRNLLPALARALHRQGLPYQVLGGQALFEFAAVKDAVAVIRLLSYPADTASAVRVLTSPRCGLNDRTVYALRNRLRSENYLESLREVVANPPDDINPAIIHAARAFCDDLGSLVHIANGQSVDILTRRIVDRQITDHPRAELQALEQLVTIAIQFNQNGVDTSLAAFVDYLDALSELPSDEARSDTPPEDGAVALMTIHGAKGLEFDVAVLAGMNQHDSSTRATPIDKIFPPALRHDRYLYPTREECADRDEYLEHVKKVEAKLNADEERRLYYVATTRARQHLYMTWSEKHPRRTSKTKRFKLLEGIDDLVQLLDIPSYPTPDDRMPLRDFFHDTGVPLDPRDSFAQVVEAWSAYWQGTPDEAAAAAALEQGLAGFEARRDERAAALDQVRRTLDDAAFRPGNRTIYSYSQINAYETCPRLYLLRYLVGVPANPANVWQTQLGSAFHDALHALHLAREAGIEPDFRTLVQRGMKNQEGSSEHSAMDIAVQGFLKSADARATPIATEQEFYLRLRSGRGAPIIRGFIDRIQRTPDGEIEIVDYKTNRQNKTRDEVLEDLQLPIYVLACREALGLEPRYATMAFVRHDNWVRLNVSDLDLYGARQRIDSAIHGITAGHFDCTCHGVHCRI